MNPNPILSIIIPLFNTEKYIEPCIHSIAQNDLAPEWYEIIVVDDGSYDGSSAIVERLCGQFANIRLVRQENQGVSVARMLGVTLSKGKYLWFIDSDDWVVENAVGSLMDLFDKYPDVDLFVAPMCLTDEKGQLKEMTHNISSYSLLSGKELLQGKNKLFVGSPHFVFRRELFDNKWLFFPKGIRYEDEYFCRVLKYIAHQVLILPQHLYYYRIWGGSHMHSLDIESAYDIVSVYRFIDPFILSEVSPEDQRWFRRDVLSFLFESLIRYPDLQKGKDYERFLRDCLPYIRKERKKHLRCLSIKDRALSAWMLCFPRHYASFMRIYYLLRVRFRKK